MTRCILVSALVAFVAEPAWGCTIVAVGKDASSTGCPLVSHTDDSGADTTDIRLIRVPRRTWPEGSKRRLYNWVDGYPRVVDAALSPEYAPVHGQKVTIPLGEIEQVPQTWAYWDMDYGVQNEWGLSIGESTATARTAGWPADKPYGFNLAGIEDLSKIAMERCKTAECAVETMGKIAVDIGFYSADSGSPNAPEYTGTAEALVVADPEELWTFNIMTGRNNASAIWAAQRIPANHVVAVGNTFTIRTMNLNDQANFRHSPGITSLAQDMGWWTPGEDPNSFDFFGVYGYVPPRKLDENEIADQTNINTLSLYSGRRMWRIYSLLSPAEGAKLDPNKGNLPTTVDPYPGSMPAELGSVTPEMVMNVLRDHYEGTIYDLTKGMSAGPFGDPIRGAAPRGNFGIWERAMSLERTSWSYVLEPQLSGRSVTWLGYDSPHGTAYLPFFGAATETAPDSFHSHDGYQSKFSHNVAWWAFNFVNQLSEVHYRVVNADVRKKAAQIELDGRERVKKCNEKANQYFQQEDALQELTRCGNRFVEEKVAEWWDFAYSLLAKFGRWSITHNESANGQTSIAYPDWWVQSPEVGYTLWAPEGPYHGVLLSGPIPASEEEVQTRRNPDPLDASKHFTSKHFTKHESAKGDAEWHPGTLTVICFLFSFLVIIGFSISVAVQLRVANAPEPEGFYVAA